MREWTVTFLNKKPAETLESARIEVTLYANDIHEAIEKACQYYGEENWFISDVSSYQSLTIA